MNLIQIGKKTTSISIGWCSEIDCKRGKINHIKTTFWGDPFDIQKLFSNNRTSWECWVEPKNFV